MMIFESRIARTAFTLNNHESFKRRLQYPEMADPAIEIFGDSKHLTLFEIPSTIMVNAVQNFSGVSL